MARALPAATLSLALFVGCAMVPEKDRDLGRIELDAGISAHKGGDARLALAQVERAIAYDPYSPEAWHFHGLVLFLPPYHKAEEAIEKYRRAIELKPDYSEARVNLGAALMSLRRWEEARDVLDVARRDLIYRDAHLAEGNYAWCLYQLGQKADALRHLTAAIQMNPRFCLGYRNVGEILAKDGELAGARKAYEGYRQSCPKVADAQHRLAEVLLRQGEACDARNAFLLCARLSRGDEAAECRRQAELVVVEGCAPPPEPSTPTRDIDVPPGAFEPAPAERPVEPTRAPTPEAPAP